LGPALIQEIINLDRCHVTNVMSLWYLPYNKKLESTEQTCNISNPLRWLFCIFGAHLLLWAFFSCLIKDKDWCQRTVVFTQECPKEPKFLKASISNGEGSTEFKLVIYNTSTVLHP
jgi:hypothetical protein